MIRNSVRKAGGINQQAKESTNSQIRQIIRLELDSNPSKVGSSFLIRR